MPNPRLVALLLLLCARPVAAQNCTPRNSAKGHRWAEWSNQIQQLQSVAKSSYSADIVANSKSRECSRPCRATRCDSAWNAKWRRQNRITRPTSEPFDHRKRWQIRKNNRGRIPLPDVLFVPMSAPTSSMRLNRRGKRCESAVCNGLRLFSRRHKRKSHSTECELRLLRDRMDPSWRAFDQLFPRSAQ